MGVIMGIDYVKVKNLAGIGFRIVLVISAGLILIYLAVMGAFVFDDEIEPLSIPPSIAGGASLALFVGAAKQLALSMRDIKNYVVENAPLDTYKEFISLLSLFFLFFVAIFTLTEFPPKGKETLDANIQWDTVYLKMNDSDPDNLATFPLVFKNARLNSRGKLDQQSEGVVVEKKHKEQIDLLIDALKPCGIAAKDRPVKLVIKGYSSSREYKDKQGNILPNTDQLNIDTANYRAKNVYEYFMREISKRKVEYGFDIPKPDSWRNMEQMIRPYTDRSKLLFPGVQELLNRSVFIKLVNPGSCGRMATE